MPGRANQVRIVQPSDGPLSDVPSSDANQPFVAKKTNWRSAPFAVQFAESEQSEPSQAPPPKTRSRLVPLLKYGSFLALVVAIVGGVLLWRYGITGIMQALNPGSPAGPATANESTGRSQQTGVSGQAPGQSPEQDKEAAFRQRQKEAKLRAANLSRRR